MLHPFTAIFPDCKMTKQIPIISYNQSKLIRNIVWVKEHQCYLSYKLISWFFRSIEPKNSSEGPNKTDTLRSMFPSTIQWRKYMKDMFCQKIKTFDNTVLLSHSYKGFSTASPFSHTLNVTSQKWLCNLVQIRVHFVSHQVWMTAGLRHNSNGKCSVEKETRRRPSMWSAQLDYSKLMYITWPALPNGSKGQITSTERRLRGYSLLNNHHSNLT